MTYFFLLLFSVAAFAEELPCVINYKLARSEVIALGIPLSPEAKTNEPLQKKFDHERCIRLGALSTRALMLAKDFHPLRITCYEVIPKARDEGLFWSSEATMRAEAACTENSDHGP